MIHTRPAVADDRDFILSGWSSSYRASRDETAPATLYAKQKHEEAAFYLDRASTLVAHGEVGVLFGFMTYDPTTYAARIGGRQVTLYGYVLYIYVAAPFRRRWGVARQLFSAAGINPLQRFGYLCRTRSSWELRSKIPLAVHEPNRARYEETTHGRRTEAAAAGAPEGSVPDPTHQDRAPGDDGSPG